VTIEIDSPWWLINQISFVYSSTSVMLQSRWLIYGILEYILYLFDCYTNNKIMRKESKLKVVVKVSVKNSLSEEKFMRFRWVTATPPPTLTVTELVVADRRPMSDRRWRARPVHRLWLEYCPSCCAVHERFEHHPMTKRGVRAMWPIESTIYYYNKTLHLPPHPNRLVAVQLFGLFHHPLRVDEPINILCQYKTCAVNEDDKQKQMRWQSCVWVCFVW